MWSAAIRPVVVVVATAVLACGCVDARGEGDSRSTQIVFSGKTMPATSTTGVPLMIAQSGGRPVVADGFMDAEPGARKVYLEASLDAPVTRIGAAFELDDPNAQDSSGGGALALMTWNDGGVAREGLGRRTRAHVWVSRYEAGYQVRTTVGGDLISVARHRFAKPLDTHRLYSLDIRLAGDTATIALPDGTEWTVTDPAVMSDDPYACIEPFYEDPLADTRFRVSRFWIDAA